MNGARVGKRVTQRAGATEGEGWGDFQSLGRSRRGRGKHAHRACQKAHLARHTLLGASLALVALHQDRAPHEHVVLEGLVHLPLPGGKTRRYWKTALAGKYCPELCQAWAGLLSGVAPVSARLAFGEAPLSPMWEQELLAAVHMDVTSVTLQSTPACPEAYVCEWT